jgi:hypothetical protein
MGGVRVAAGDINGDGRAEIITGAGPGGGPEVRAFSFKNPVPIRDFFAFPPNFMGGVFVASIDVNGDLIDDIIVGAGAGGLPQVNVFNGGTTALLSAFFAFGPQVPKVDSIDELAGVRVAGACEGCPHSEIITALGPGGEPIVNVFDARTSLTAGAFPKPGGSFLAFDRLFLNGVFVGGF